MDLAQHIRNVPDFPKPGIQFKDITTLLLVPEAFRYVIGQFKARYTELQVDAIVGVDARGFIFAASLAHEMGLPLITARKKGKLPADTIAEEYELEYGTAIVEMHRDSVKPGDSMVIIDDLLATGGTVGAVVRLIERLGGRVTEAAFVVELPPLGGRKRLDPVPVHSLVEFMVD
ncbi:MAG: adenine phosphoribosyltransferase [Candidatus Hydrogenedentes bacterium]|nr:adenine phosphoribosyltransferase [Candidatus Hydrogenedentota bacterium]